MRISTVPRAGRAREHFGVLFRYIFRVPKSASQNTRKCLELASDTFGELFGLAVIVRARKLILDCGSVYINFFFVFCISGFHILSNCQTSSNFLDSRLAIGLKGMETSLMQNTELNCIGICFNNELLSSPDFC